MNVQLLIDSIVRQTTVLIAELATSGGVRAPLAHVANQVFLDLSSELNAQGVSRKVSANMFGMALRSYLRRIRRLSESSTERGRSLSDAVLDFLSDGRLATRAEMLARFHRDDAELVRAVLYDLTESGLLFRSGSGERTSYRAASDVELDNMRRASGAPIDEFVWVIIYRNGPLSRDALLKLTGSDNAELDSVLARLTSQARIQTTDRPEGRVFSSSEFVIPLGSVVGWEASVFDHFQAVVKTVCRRLRAEPGTVPADTGGSTYTFDVWPGHPLEDDVRGLLARTRRALSELRQRAEAHAKEHGIPERHEQIVFYCGQCAIPQDGTD